MHVPRVGTEPIKPMAFGENAAHLAERPGTLLVKTVARGLCEGLARRSAQPTNH